MSEEQSKKQPEAETLSPRAANGTEVEKASPAASKQSLKDSGHKIPTYRPSHKATFIGLAVVLLIILLNGAVLMFLLHRQAAKSVAYKGVSISPKTLSKLGVNNTSIGNGNEELVVAPSAQFNNQLAVAGNVKIGGQLVLNSTFVATSANLAQLQAGSTQLASLNVNGNSTESNLSLRGNLGVSGPASFQNTLTVGQILTVQNSAAIANNLSVGGQITANTVATTNLILSGTFVFGSHIQTNGHSPSAGPGGSALGNNGTISINGDDAAGTIDINIGTNASAGELVRVAFKTPYTSQPRVVITPVGVAGEFYLSSLSESGFSVAVGGGLPDGDYQLDYIVMQ